VCTKASGALRTCRPSFPRGNHNRSRQGWTREDGTRGFFAPTQSAGTFGSRTITTSCPSRPVTFVQAHLLERETAFCKWLDHLSNLLVTGFHAFSVQTRETAVIFSGHGREKRRDQDHPGGAHVCRRWPVVGLVVDKSRTLTRDSGSTERKSIGCLPLLYM
jgi:hypothetical protein